LPSFETYLLFVAASAVLVVTPGPNMIYLVSRSLCQGREAGYVSLAGVMLGFVFHVTAAALVLSAIGDGAIVYAAGSISRWLAKRPLWLAVQRWVLGLTLLAIAIRLAFDGGEARR
jgi:threonine/homoserine/homoserine lactone efflux protein